MPESLLMLINIMRFLSPIMALGLLVFSTISLFRDKGLEAIYATLVEKESDLCFPLRHLECSIGRANSCDISISLPTVSRIQAVLRFTKNGFLLYNMSSVGTLTVNGEAVKGSCLLGEGDVIGIGGMNFSFSINDRVETGTVKKRSGSIPMMFLLTVFQLITFTLAVAAAPEEGRGTAVVVLLGVLAVEWATVIWLLAAWKAVGLELELCAFFLVGIGFAVLVRAGAAGLFTQFCALIIGVVIYFALLWLCADIDRTTRLRHAAALIALALFAFNLVFGKNISGARNWVIIGSIRFQPSELIKIFYIFAGAATLDRLLTTRNLALWIGFSAACVGALFLMGDFGTAAIFFVTFLIISYLRSGDIRAISLIGAAAAFGGLLIIKFKPYIAGRFATWGRAFEFADGKGYQQSRTLVGVGSGGLFGVGQGEGRLHKVTASTTDLIFGVISEEWGLIVALSMMLIFVLFVIYALRGAGKAKSSFYTITGVAAAGLMLFQACLHAFGATDILPLTGVTLPFISRGGSSMISSFGLLAFLKALDPEFYTKKKRVSRRRVLL